MPRWIAFDSQTSQALRAGRSRENVIEISSGSAWDYALGNENPVVAMLPSPPGQEATIAIFRRAKPVSAPVYTSGFLGLSDAPAYEEQPPKKKSWWGRFWDE